jgi:hypothetical protein
MATACTSTTTVGSTVKASNPSSTGKYHNSFQNNSCISKPSEGTTFKVTDSFQNNRLDVGEGKDVSLDDQCPRWKLHKQCIKYLGPVSFMAPQNRTQKQSVYLAAVTPTTDNICCHNIVPKEREAYAVIVKNAKLIYKMSSQTVDTAGGDKGIKWIFILSTCKNLYIGQVSLSLKVHTQFWWTFTAFQ